MENILTVEEFVKHICKEASDESIIKQIEWWKTEPFPSMFENTTWYEISKDYFKKYLNMFGRTNISL